MSLLPTPEAQLAPLGFLTDELLGHEVLGRSIQDETRIIDIAANSSGLIIPSLVVINRPDTRIPTSQYELDCDVNGRLRQVKSKGFFDNFPEARLTIQERSWGDNGQSYVDIFPESPYPVSSSHVSFLDDSRVEIEAGENQLIAIEESSQEDGGRIITSTVATRNAGTERYVTAYDQTGKPLHETHEEQDDFEFGGGPTTTKVWHYDESGELITVSVYGRGSYVEGEEKRAPDLVYQISKNKSGNYKINKTIPVYDGLVSMTEARKYDSDNRPYEITRRGLVGHDNDANIKLHYD